MHPEQDDECNILTVGSWYAMTGYGLAFPKDSKENSNTRRRSFMFWIYSSFSSFDTAVLCILNLNYIISKYLKEISIKVL